MLVHIEVLASQVAAHAGVSTPLAEYALRAVVTGMGAYLPPASRQLVAEELPEPLAVALGSAPNDRRPIEERVQLAGMTPSQTRELIASVCHVLADELSTDALTAVTASLPQPTSSMFVPSSPTVLHGSRLHRQASSVAEPNPHGETKLSSARGTTQQREHETLAEAHGTTQEREHETLAEAHGTTQEREHATLAEWRGGSRRDLN